jgi:hypothetical protein
MFWKIINISKSKGKWWTFTLFTPVWHVSKTIQSEVRQFTRAIGIGNMDMWNFKHPIKKKKENKIKSINSIKKHIQSIFVMKKWVEISKGVWRAYCKSISQGDYCHE